MRRTIASSILLLLCAPHLAESLPAAFKVPAAMPMPADRATDSYRIYSSLLPFGEMASPMWPHSLLLVRDTTITVVEPNQPCFVPPAQNTEMNPHNAVKPPKDQLANFKEILQDFDQHCHERIRLQASAFPMNPPPRTLNDKEEAAFESTRSSQPADKATAARYKGASAFYAFSQVYFNAHHTAALVYATDWCGNVCAHSQWFAFVLKDGRWHSQGWGSVIAIS